MPLTDVAIRNAKPREKLYKLYDGRGLYLEVHPGGSRYWRYRYRYSGKDKRIALGVHPTVSLADARGHADDKRKLLRSGIDPAAERKADKDRAKAETENSFEKIAREWLTNHSGRWSVSHLERIRHSLEVDEFPFFGSNAITAIAAPDILKVLRAIESRNALDVAARVRQRCEAVFRYGIATGRLVYNPAADLRGALKVPEQSHRPALMEKDLPEFLAKLDTYQGHTLGSVGCY